MRVPYLGAQDIGVLWPPIRDRIYKFPRGPFERGIQFEAYDVSDTGKSYLMRCLFSRGEQVFAVPVPPCRTVELWKI